MPIVERMDIGAMVAPLASDKREAILGVKSVSAAETPEGTLSPSPLWWSRIRADCRLAFSEFFGTMILVLFGNGVVAQVILSEGQKGDYQSISWGWG